MNNKLEYGYALCYDDVLIKPEFSTVASRSEVDTTTYVGCKISIPVIGSNMDSVVDEKMAKLLVENGAQACLPRFMSVEDNVTLFKQLENSSPFVSVGIKDGEFERLTALYNVGARKVFVEVAHAANSAVADFFVKAKSTYPACWFSVGTFGTSGEVIRFNKYLCERNSLYPDAYIVGVGGGSACKTRIETGCGYPMLQTILDVKAACPSVKIIASGGHKNTGDIAKALAAGADAVMIGQMFARTLEAPGRVVHIGGKAFKEYAGSASLPQYEKQGKVSSFRTPEGVVCEFPWESLKSLREVLDNINGGLRSAFSYVGAKDLYEFQNKAKFVIVTTNSLIESKPHGLGKNNV